MFYCVVLFAARPKTLIVVLDWFINPNHAPLFVAAQEGFFAKRGIQVKFISPADTAAGEKMVAANQADIVVTYQPALMYYIDQKLPLIRFATLIDKPLGCLVILPDDNIQSLADLKGKRIGYSSPDIDKMVLVQMLKAADLDENDITLINVKFNLMQALLTNKIDGFIGGMRNFEPLALKLAGKKPLVFYPEKYGFPPHDELILVTNKRRINDPDLVKFTAALQDAVIYLKKNPGKSWQKFADNHPELNNVLHKKSWLISLSYFADNPAKLDHMRYQSFAEFMWGKGLIKSLPKIEEYAKLQ